MGNIDGFLSRFQDGKIEGVETKWSEVIKPTQTYLIIGDVGTGKTALAFWVLETFSKQYDLLPAVIGLPEQKTSLLPPNFVNRAINDVSNLEDAIIFIDEAELQLPIEDTKKRGVVANFLGLPRHRNQILLLSFHFPRLILGRYLPYFSAFLFKRPPYLIDFAGKRQGDELTEMMKRAEERFSELQNSDVVKNTYVVAPRIRWQGLLTNPLCSFWNDELSKAWSGVDATFPNAPASLFSPQVTMPAKIPTTTTQKGIDAPKGWKADDLTEQPVHHVTYDMISRATPVPGREYSFEKRGYIIMEDSETKIRWIRQIYGP